MLSPSARTPTGGYWLCTQIQWRKRLCCIFHVLHLGQSFNILIFVGYAMYSKMRIQWFCICLFYFLFFKILSQHFHIFYHTLQTGGRKRGSYWLCLEEEESKACANRLRNWQARIYSLQRAQVSLQCTYERFVFN